MQIRPYERYFLPSSLHNKRKLGEVYLSYLNSFVSHNNKKFQQILLSSVTQWKQFPLQLQLILCHSPYWVSSHYLLNHLPKTNEYMKMILKILKMLHDKMYTSYLTLFDEDQIFNSNINQGFLFFVQSWSCLIDNQKNKVYEFSPIGNVKKIIFNLFPYQLAVFSG